MSDILTALLCLLTAALLVLLAFGGAELVTRTKRWRWFLCRIGKHQPNLAGNCRWCKRPA